MHPLTSELSTNPEISQTFSTTIVSPAFLLPIKITNNSIIVSPANVVIIT